MIRNIAGMAERVITGGRPSKVLRLAKSVSPAVIESMKRRNLKWTLGHVLNKSTFYKENLSGIDIDFTKIKHPSELGDFFTTSGDISQYPSESFLCGKPHRAFETTGSTGKPKRVYFSNKEFADLSRWGAASLYMLGMREADRVISTFDFAFWIPGITIQDMIKHVGAFHVVGGKIAPSEIVSRIDDYNFNVIMGDPSWIIQFTELVKDHKKYNVKLLLGGGEHVSDDIRKRIEEAWGADMILSYGSTEMGGASSSECLEKNGYHLNDFAFFFEIINPDKDGYGEVVFTTLVRDTMPLIRYRTGDIARFIEDTCPCGMQTKRLSKIRGRVDDMVVLGAGNMFPWIFESILHDIPEISNDWQVAVLKPECQDVLEFRMEKVSNDETAILDKVKTNIRKRFNDIWKNYEVGMCDIRFSLHERGSLRKGRKIKRLIDERINTN